jgi:hypothetical protein
MVIGNCCGNIRAPDAAEVLLELLRQRRGGLLGSSAGKVADSFLCARSSAG